ncbi:MAG: serine hydrolase [Planctomycetota bacterium]|nr:serine hydrolase [Planctomycetota bacterium]
MSCTTPSTHRLLPALALLALPAALGGCQHDAQHHAGYHHHHHHDHAHGHGHDHVEWLTRPELLQRMFDGYGTGDLALWDQHLAADARCSMNAARMNGTGFIAEMRRSFESFEDRRITGVEVLAVKDAADRIMTPTRFRWSATAIATGRPVEVDCMAWIQWEGNTIVVFEEVFDEVPIREALEVPDAPASARLMDSVEQRAELVRSRFASMDLPAAVCAVVTADGHAEFVELGTRTPGDPTPVDADSLFDIASMTKAVTTVAALQMVEQGRVSLDQPLEGILPELAEIEILHADGTRTPATRPITLRDLLRHTAGFGYSFTSPQIMAELELDPSTGWPLPETIAEGEYDWGFGVQPRRVFESGTDWQYGRNLGVVGRMVERLSGQDLDTYFKEHVFMPLGMTRSGYNPEASLLADRVQMHVRDPGTGVPRPGQPFRPDRLETFYGGGGLYSTPRDYGRFLACLLNGGELDGVRILDRSLVEEMAEDQLPEGILVTMEGFPGADPDRRSFTNEFDDGYGLAWAIDHGAKDGLRPEGVGYWSGIHNTYYTFDPERGVAVMFFSQMQPFDDVAAYELYRTWEDEVYRSIL